MIMILFSAVTFLTMIFKYSFDSVCFIILFDFKIRKLNIYNTFYGSMNCSRRFFSDIITYIDVIFHLNIVAFEKIL